MSYSDQAALYVDATFRSRANICIHEQGLIFTADGRPDIQALGAGVVAGKPEDVEAVLMATVTYSGAGDLTTDAALLSTVQTIWPTVAAARYPQ